VEARVACSYTKCFLLQISTHAHNEWFMTYFSFD
jgi:hypothetical protein